jgi:serine phosphatase RsbU (regulator of sigma subunit)
MAGTALTWGAAGRPRPGERTSGDQYIVQETTTGILVAVVDGAGHGTEATLAATRVVETVRAHPDVGVLPLAKQCHDALRGTRGAVMTLASFRPADGTMTWMAVGNVAGLVLRASPGPGPRMEAVLQRGGVLGYSLPALSAAVLPMARGDLVVFATDGVVGEFMDTIALDAGPQDLADTLISAFAHPGDDALAVVARYHGLP